MFRKKKRKKKYRKKKLSTGKTKENIIHIYDNCCLFLSLKLRYLLVPKETNSALDTYFLVKIIFSGKLNFSHFSRM